MRRLDIHLNNGDACDNVIRAVKASDPIDYYVTPLQQKDRSLISVFVRDGSGQALMDNIQTCLEHEQDWRISLLPIEATAPMIETLEEGTPDERNRKQALREEIYEDVVGGAKLDRDFVSFVVLATIVAAISVNSDSVAGVIGAMVIAPLLGPVLGFSLGAALGDSKLLTGSGLTMVVGILIVLLCSVLISFVLPVDLESQELMSRAQVRLDGMVLAIAAGAAAALSMANGQGAVLVGVMVAAALLPPGAAVGLFLGDGQWGLASRAGMLLALNVASLVFAALVVFRLRDIQPRKWLERKDAQRAVVLNIVLSLAFLAVCVVLILVLDLGKAVSSG